MTPLGTLGSRLEERLTARSATVGVVGLGYVGLPLAVAFARAGFRVIGADADPARAALLAAGTSPVEDVPSADLRPLVESGRLAVHPAPDALGEADAIVICVPTPLGKSDPRRLVAEARLVVDTRNATGPLGAHRHVIRI